MPQRVLFYYGDKILYYLDLQSSHPFISFLFYAGRRWWKKIEWPILERIFSSAWAISSFPGKQVRWTGNKIRVDLPTEGFSALIATIVVECCLILWIEQVIFAREREMGRDRDGMGEREREREERTFVHLSWWSILLACPPDRSGKRLQYFLLCAVWRAHLLK